MSSIIQVSNNEKHSYFYSVATCYVLNFVAMRSQLNSHFCPVDPILSTAAGTLDCSGCNSHRTRVHINLSRIIGTNAECIECAAVMLSSQIFNCHHRTAARPKTTLGEALEKCKAVGKLGKTKSEREECVWGEKGGHTYEGFPLTRIRRMRETLRG